MAERAQRILLVDDEESIRTLLSFPLRKDGYEVVTADDGKAALERFAESTFDLVVLDVMMPRLDGLEVCRRLRARSTVPIIMLTAKTEEVDKVVGLELGADDYIAKPFHLREVLARVRAVLRRYENVPAGAPQGARADRQVRLGGEGPRVAEHRRRGRRVGPVEEKLHGGGAAGREVVAVAARDDEHRAGDPPLD